MINQRRSAFVIPISCYKNLVLIPSSINEYSSLNPEKLVTYSNGVKMYFLCLILDPKDTKGIRNEQG